MNWRVLRLVLDSKVVFSQYNFTGLAALSGEGVYDTMCCCQDPPGRNQGASTRRSCSPRVEQANLCFQTLFSTLIHTYNRGKNIGNAAKNGLIVRFCKETLRKSIGLLRCNKISFVNRVSRWYWQLSGSGKVIDTEEPTIQGYCWTAVSFPPTIFEPLMTFPQAAKNVAMTRTADVTMNS